MNRETIVIIGAGHAGGRMAISLRELGYDGRIVLLGEEDALPYERPPLSKEMITGKTEFGSSALGDRTFWEERQIELRLGRAVTEVDADNGIAILENGEGIPFDHLVFANGATARRLPVFEEPSLPVSYLRNLDDSRWIRRQLETGKEAIIVGAGVIGLELASSIVECGGAATVIEAASSVMGRAVTPIVAERLLRLHKARGVRFHFDTVVTEACAANGGILITLDNGAKVLGDFAVAGIGITPNDRIAREAGVHVNDGIIVDEQGRTNLDTIWAVGDVARFPMNGELVRQETWRHADNHSRAVAAAILGSEIGYNEVPGFWSDQVGVRLQIEGQLEGEEVVRESASESEQVAAFYIQESKLIGAAIFQNPKLATLARRAIANAQQIDRAALANPELSPKLTFATPGSR